MRLAKRPQKSNLPKAGDTCWYCKQDPVLVCPDGMALGMCERCYEFLRRSAQTNLRFG